MRWRVIVSSKLTNHDPTLDTELETHEGRYDVPILVLVLLVDAAHERSGRWQDLIDKNKDGLLWRKLDALADYVDELPNGEIGWYEVLLFVDRRNVALLNLFADDGDTVGVLLAL